MNLKQQPGTSYRTLAEYALGHAGALFNEIKQGDYPTQIVEANAARVQAAATMALVQAVLHLGDVIASQQSSPEQP